MDRKVNWAYEATADLEALAEYIARDSAFYALEVAKNDLIKFTIAI